MVKHQLTIGISTVHSLKLGGLTYQLSFNLKIYTLQDKNKLIYLSEFHPNTQKMYICLMYI